MEELIYDANGQLLTGSLAEYLIPSATDFPRIRAISLQHRPSPTNPLGVKGAGEGGIIPVGGLMANAIRRRAVLIRCRTQRITALATARVAMGQPILGRREKVALVPLATKGNYFHVYDFRVKPGRGDEFVELFNKFDYGDNNPFHRSRA